MNDGRKRMSIILGIGILIGLPVGLGVSGSLAPPPGLWRQHVPTAESQTSVEQSPRPDPNVITLDDAQARHIKIEPVQLRSFREQKTAVGRIAFSDERTTSIFAPFQGRVVRLIAKAGDSVRPGSPLLIIDSPDLVQANADLIAASVAVKKTQNQLTFAERVATRQRLLYEAGAGAYKDFEQAESDLRNAQHDLKMAEGQRESARDRLRAPFGKSDAEIARIEETHHVDRVTHILSPIAGTVTVRKVSPAQFVRSDNTDPLYSVADVSSMWLVANVAEVDIPLIKVGQAVTVQVMAYPGEVFRARISYVGASVDPAVRRLTVRAEIPNHDGKLKPDMFASFRILTGAPAQSPSVPAGAVVREGDGTMTALVTTDRKRLVKRTVRVGLQQAGFDQILEGLQPGELVVTESALFLDNVLTSGQ
ncbi:MAG TPA: efflux RND transporter periplasmic adaptor subunit [Methylomirabilota bacterium]|nr:efflux RND transporter periplasmic adaptor subunit [Methylomirabilota bacterium]